jgi:hypothetical protein
MSKVLYLKGTGTRVAELDDREFDKLCRALQAESSTDTDYFVNESALLLLESRGVSPALVRRLRGLLQGGAEAPAPAPTHGAFRDRYRPDEEQLAVPARVSDDESGIDIEWRDE